MVFRIGDKIIIPNIYQPKSTSSSTSSGSTSTSSKTSTSTGSLSPTSIMNAIKTGTIGDLLRSKLGSSTSTSSKTSTSTGSSSSGSRSTSTSSRSSSSSKSSTPKIQPVTTFTGQVVQPWMPTYKLWSTIQRIKDQKDSTKDQGIPIKTSTGKTVYYKDVGWDEGTPQEWGLPAGTKTVSKDNKTTMYIDNKLWKSITPDVTKVYDTSTGKLRKTHVTGHPDQILVKKKTPDTYHISDKGTVILHKGEKYRDQWLNPEYVIYKDLGGEDSGRPQEWGLPAGTKIVTKPTGMTTIFDKSGKKTKEYMNVAIMPESPYLKKYGYLPNDPDYFTIKSDITSKKGLLETGITDIGLYSGQAKDYNLQMKSDIEMIKNAPKGSTFTVGDQEGLSSSEAINLLQGRISKNLEVIGQESLIPEYKKSLRDIKSLEFQIGQYEKKGYEVDLKKDSTGEITDYEFKLPSALSVHEWKYPAKNVLGGASQTDVMLGSSAFIQSPFAIGTGIDWLVEKATGKSRNIKENLAQYSLGLSDALDEGAGQYIWKVGTGGAMVEGVLIPLATLGTGYALSGIKAGATGASVMAGKSSGMLGGLASKSGRALYSVGSKGGMGLYNTIRVGSGVVGGGMLLYGAGQVGQGLQSGNLSLYDLPRIGGELAFTIGMAGAGYKAGQSMWKARHPIVKNINIVGETDVLQSRMLMESGKPSDKFNFELWSKQNVGDQPVSLEMAGGGEYYPDLKTSLSSGEGWIKYTKKPSWFKRTFGIGKSEEWLHKFEIPSDKASTTIRTTMGDYTTSDYVTQSVLSAGKKGNYGYGKIGFEPVTSKGTVTSRLVGNAEFPLDEWGSKLIMDNVEHYGFMSQGDWMGNFAKGSNVQMGNIYNILPQAGGGGAGAGGGSGGILSISKSGGGLLSGTLGKTEFTGANLGDVLGQMSGHVVELHSAGLGSFGATGAGAGIGGLGLSMKSSGGGRQMSIQKPQSLNVSQSNADVISLAQPSGSRASLVSVLRSSNKSGLGLSVQSGAGGGLAKAVSIQGSQSQQKQPLLINVGQGIGQGLQLGQRGRQGMGLLSVQMFSPKTEIDYNQKTFSGELFSPTQSPVFDLGYKEGEEYEPIMGTTSMVGLATDQAQTQKSGLVSLTELMSPTPTTVTPINAVPPITPIIPPPIFGGWGSGENRASRSSFWQWGGGKGGKRVLVKTVLADPFLVQYSQVHFGKATHMIPSKKLWKLGEKTWWRLPTKEISMAGGIAGLSGKSSGKGFMSLGGNMSFGKVMMDGNNKNSKISLNVLGGGK